MYAVIVENDVSQWDDKAGVHYHFPKRYINILMPETKIIYYKGAIRDKIFNNIRMHTKPHYFGVGTIDVVKEDMNSKKNDFYATIKEYKKFKFPVLAKNSGKYLEEIPEALKSNYWRHGVRRVSKEVFERILGLSGVVL